MKFDQSLPHCQKSSMQVLQSAPGELGLGAANRSVNPNLICPPYILWLRRVHAGSDPSSPDPRPVVARPATHRRVISAVVTQSSSSSHKQHPSSPDPVPIVGRCIPIVARAAPVVVRPCTRRRALHTRHRLFFYSLPYSSSCIADLSSRAVDPSSRVASRRRTLQTRRRAVRTRRRALHTRRRMVRNSSSRPFPRPPCTRPRVPYKYARVLLFPRTLSEHPGLHLPR